MAGTQRSGGGSSLGPHSVRAVRVAALAAFVAFNIAFVITAQPDLAFATEDSNRKVASPVVASYVVEENSTGAWLKVADYPQGQDIPFSVTGTMPQTLEQQQEFPYWLVVEVGEGLLYVDGSARVYVVHEGGSTQDVTSQIAVRLANGVLEAGSSDICSAIPGLLSTDNIRLVYNARFTPQALLGLAQGNSSYAHIEYAGEGVTSEVVDASPAVAWARPLLRLANDVRLVLAKQSAQGQTRNATLSHSPKIVTNVFTYRADVYKVAQDTGRPLQGARFALRDAKGLWYVSQDDWSEDQARATVVTTDAQGFASFAGIDSETYELVEILSPQGYATVGPVDVALSTDVPEGSAATLKASSKVATSIDADADNGIVKLVIEDPASLAVTIGRTAQTPSTGDAVNGRAAVIATLAGLLLLGGGLFRRVGRQ